MSHKNSQGVNHDVFKIQKEVKSTQTHPSCETVVKSKMAVKTKALRLVFFILSNSTIVLLK